MTLPPNQRPVCVCYCRVSTKAQGNDGLSMDNQEQHHGVVREEPVHTLVLQGHCQRQGQ